MKRGIIITASIALILLFILFMVKSNYFLADTANNDNNTQLDLVSGDGSKTAFILKKTNGKFRLEYQGLFNFKKSYPLSNFRENANFCPVSIFSPSTAQADLICVTGDAGVHSQQIEIFRYEGKGISPLQFTDNSNVKTDTLVSDAPKFQLSDYNNDGKVDVISENRNYDKNPVMDVVRYYYKYESSKFVFDKQEKVSY